MFRILDNLNTIRIKEAKFKYKYRHFQNYFKRFSPMPRYLSLLHQGIGSKSLGLTMIDGPLVRGQRVGGIVVTLDWT